MLAYIYNMLYVYFAFIYNLCCIYMLAYIYNMLYVYSCLYIYAVYIYIYACLYIRICCIYVCFWKPAHSLESKHCTGAPCTLDNESVPSHTYLTPTSIEQVPLCGDLRHAALLLVCTTEWSRTTSRSLAMYSLLYLHVPPCIEGNYSVNSIGSTQQQSVWVSSTKLRT